LYFKELIEAGKLPLSKSEMNFLYRKMKKRQSLNLTMYLLRKKDWTSFRQVMRETEFDFSDLLSGYFK
jgi:hypothetical protein